jgi:hypothetical protein
VDVGRGEVLIADDHLRDALAAGWRRIDDETLPMPVPQPESAAEDPSLLTEVIKELEKAQVKADAPADRRIPRR